MAFPTPRPLNHRTLATLAQAVRVPVYDRGAVVDSIVHIGVGGFFRAHQAVYLDDLLTQSGQTEWGYCGVGLLDRDARMRDAMRGQECLYTVVERSAAGDAARVVGSLLRYLHAPQDPTALLEKLASPRTRIVSLTITEGGYYINEGSGEFDDAHPDIIHDLEHPRNPQCTFGFLVEALARRRERGLDPFVIMSCDNLPHNGTVARRMLLAFAEQRDPVLAAWIADHGAFPNSMVDRITPTTTEAHRALVARRYGIDDAWPVLTERFSQWVIEDEFPPGRPAWEMVGVNMTSDVRPYELMKLRLLNAGHQTICYLGMLLGYQYAHEALADVRIRTLLRRTMDVEITPLLTPPPGIDLEAYKATLIARFSDTALSDQLSRIGTEGSVRIPQFVLPSIMDALDRGGPMKLLSFTVAVWFRYLTGTDDVGREMPMSDPMAIRLREEAHRGGRDPDALLSLRELFGPALASSPDFTEAVRSALGNLYDKGVESALTEIIKA